MGNHNREIDFALLQFNTKTNSFTEKQHSIINSLSEPRIIVAYNFRHPEQSVILRRNVSGALEEAISDIDVTAFVGRGIWICEASEIDSIDDAEDFSCQINFDGKPTAFEIKTIFQVLPLVEGEFAPGIYCLEQFDFNCCELKDALALTDFLNLITDLDHENLKFVCRADGISLRNVGDDEELCFFARHPFSYFDVHCPLCRQKVMTYRIADDDCTCEILTTPCPHFVGSAFWLGGSYETEELDDLKINYKFEREDLYFETSAGWEKTIIYAPPHDPANCYWDDSSTDDTCAYHFFFVKSEPQFRTERQKLLG